MRELSVAPTVTVDSREESLIQSVLILS